MLRAEYLGGECGADCGAGAVGQSREAQTCDAQHG